MMTVFHGLAYPRNLSADSPAGYTNCRSLAGAIYFTTVLQMFLNFLPTVIIFQGEKPVYVRERDSGLYHIWIYATTKLLAEFPIMLFVPLLLNTLLFWVIGYENRIDTFLRFYLVLMLMVNAASALGYFLSSVFNHETTAVAFAPIVNLPLNLLGGFMISLKNIFQHSPQKYIAWLSYISPVRWGFQGMMLSQFEPIALGDFTGRLNTTNTTLLLQFEYNAAEVLDAYNFCENCTDTKLPSEQTYASYWEAILFLAGIFLMFRVLVVVSLAIQDAKFRNSSGDTRNTTIQSGGRDKTMLVVSKSN